MPQANSATSRPRVTSPRASSRTLPCSAVMSAAMSFLLFVEQLAEREQHLRALGERGVGPARPGVLGGGHDLAHEVGRGEVEDAGLTSPVAGLKTSLVRSAVPDQGLPAMRWVMRVGVLISLLPCCRGSCGWSTCTGRARASSAHPAQHRRAVREVNPHGLTGRERLHAGRRTRPSRHTRPRPSAPRPRPGGRRRPRPGPRGRRRGRSGAGSPSGTAPPQCRRARGTVERCRLLRCPR